MYIFYPIRVVSDGVFTFIKQKEMDEYCGILEIVEDVFGNYKNYNTYSHQLSVDCPVCSYDIKNLEHGDGKSNLEINLQMGVYNCWSCSDTHNTKGSLYKLIKTYGNKKQLNDFILLKPDSIPEKQKIVHSDVELPKEYIKFKDASKGLQLTPQFKTAFNYIKKRNISSELLNKFNIGFCYEGFYANRIIIPSYDKNDVLNYFIARSYLSKPDLKYRNPNVEKEKIIWNEKLINWDSTIYIVEGAFDSIFIPNSIAMLGKHLSENLFNKIYDNAKKDVIIVLDPDARNNQTKLFHQLNCGKLMNRVWVIELDGDKDIADLCGNISNYELRKLD